MSVRDKPEGRKRSAVWTVDDLRDRCWVDEVTKCWHWRGGHTSYGAPSLWIPAIDRAGTIGAALCVLTQGRRLREGETWHSVCGTRHCGNPAHNISGTAATSADELDRKQSAATRARISETRRKRSKVTEQHISEIRASKEYAKVLAPRYGISESYVNKLRAGDRRLPCDAAPNASVFNWRPA